MPTNNKRYEQLKQVQGSVSVGPDATETPITRRPIHQIDADLWPEMTTASLVDQRTLLNNRMVLAQSMGAPHIGDQLRMYLRVLDQMIADRPDSEEVHLV